MANGAAPNTNVKPGYQTTEFWAMCGAQITAFIVALTAADPTAKIMTGTTALCSILAYMYTRHKQKMALLKS